jgi:Flp pilus assembly protein TadG
VHHTWGNGRARSGGTSRRRRKERRQQPSRRLTSGDRERGATLVEFALVVPLLMLFIFGAIDFGWAFGQNINIRGAVREGARLAVVDAGVGSSPDARRDDLITKIKQRALELEPAQTAVYIALQDDNGNGTAGEVGETVVVCSRYPLRSLSGLTERFLSGDLRSKAVMRMEHLANFSSGGTTTPPWGSDPCTAS